MKWASVSPVVRTGKAYQEIIQQAIDANSDVIVMGVLGRNALDIALFGSTTYRVIQLGPCPVLVIRT
jgi:nucleotide-binding universal stress UspA family protein